MRRRPARILPACHTSACPVANIFVITGDIGGRKIGGGARCGVVRCSSPRDGQGGRRVSGGGGTRNNWRAKARKARETIGKTVWTETMVTKEIRGIRRVAKDLPSGASTTVQGTITVQMGQTQRIVPPKALSGTDRRRRSRCHRRRQRP